MLRTLIVLAAVAVPASAQTARDAYRDWLASAVPEMSTAKSTEQLERGVCWDPSSSTLAGHRWVAVYMDRPAAPVKRQAMPLGTPSPYHLNGTFDVDPSQTDCGIRASYRAWQGWTGGVNRCQQDRQGEAACGVESRPIYARSLERLYALNRPALTTRSGCDGVATRYETWLATTTCATQAICASNRLPGGLQAPECSNPAVCAVTEGCFTSARVPAGTIGAIQDTAYGCGTIPVCGTGKPTTPPPPRCGDGKVDAEETCANCPADVGPCPPPADFSCDYGVSCRGGVISITGTPRVTAPGAPCGSIEWRPGTASTGTAGNSLARVCLNGTCQSCQ